MAHYVYREDIRKIYFTAGSGPFLFKQVDIRQKDYQKMINRNYILPVKPEEFGLSGRYPRRIFRLSLKEYNICVKRYGALDEEPLIQASICVIMGIVNKGGVINESERQAEIEADC